MPLTLLSMTTLISRTWLVQQVYQDFAQWGPIRVFFDLRGIHLIIPIRSFVSSDFS